MSKPESHAEKQYRLASEAVTEPPWKQFQLLAEQHGDLRLEQAYWRGAAETSSRLCMVLGFGSGIAVGFGLAPMPLWMLAFPVGVALFGLWSFLRATKIVEQRRKEATALIDRYIDLSIPAKVAQQPSAKGFN